MIECTALSGGDCVYFGLYKRLCEAFICSEHLLSALHEIKLAFNAFIFENFMQQLKKLVRTGRNPVVQIANRVCDTMTFINNEQSITINIMSLCIFLHLSHIVLILILKHWITWK